MRWGALRRRHRLLRLERVNGLRTLLTMGRRRAGQRGLGCPLRAPSQCVRALKGRPTGLLSQKRLRWTGGVAATTYLLALLAVNHFTPPGASLPLPVGAVIAQNDRVLLLDAYFYEIPFY